VLQYPIKAVSRCLQKLQGEEAKAIEARNKAVAAKGSFDKQIEDANNVVMGVREQLTQHENSQKESKESAKAHNAEVQAKRREVCALHAHAARSCA
jgi:hypothetical protein